jgi:hypothetical protein
MTALGDEPPGSDGNRSDVIDSESGTRIEIRCPGPSFGNDARSGRGQHLKRTRRTIHAVADSPSERLR